MNAAESARAVERGIVAAERPFMDLTTGSRVCSPQGDKQGTTSMRKAILGAASALALASPAVAADLPVPRYSEVPSYEPEVRTYGYRTAPPVIVEEPAFIVAPPVVEEYPVYAAPRVYTAPPLYAYAHPVWRDGWGHRRHYRGRW
jgi:hypothetical protein